MDLVIEFDRCAMWQLGRRAGEHEHRVSRREEKIERGYGVSGRRSDETFGRRKLRGSLKSQGGGERP